MVHKFSVIYIYTRLVLERQLEFVFVLVDPVFHTFYIFIYLIFVVTWQGTEMNDALCIISILRYDETICLVYMNIDKKVN